MVLGLAVLATYSRAGFLTISVVAACLAFRLRRRYPAVLAAGVAVALIVVILAPASFWGRVFTVFDTSDDRQAAESSEIRWALLQRSLEVAGFNPQRWIFGIGMNELPHRVGS